MYISISRNVQTGYESFILKNRLTPQKEKKEKKI